MNIDKKYNLKNIVEFRKQSHHIFRKRSNFGIK